MNKITDYIKKTKIAYNLILVIFILGVFYVLLALVQFISVELSDQKLSIPQEFTKLGHDNFIVGIPAGWNIERTTNGIHTFIYSIPDTLDSFTEENSAFSFIDIQSQKNIDGFTSDILQNQKCKILNGDFLENESLSLSEIEPIRINGLNGCIVNYSTNEGEFISRYVLIQNSDVYIIDVVSYKSESQFRQANMSAKTFKLVK